MLLSMVRRLAPLLWCFGANLSQQGPVLVPLQVLWTCGSVRLQADRPNQGVSGCCAAWGAAARSCGAKRVAGPARAPDPSAVGIKLALGGLAPFLIMLGVTHLSPPFHHAHRRRVFLLGPSHHFYSKHCLLSPLDEYGTPLGALCYAAWCQGG